MKLQPGQFKSLLNDTGALRALLLFGPDEGLIRERAEQLTRAVAEDPKDPFRVAYLQASEVIEDPARLADEAAAISMMGGRRVIRIDDAGDRMAGAVEQFLEHAPGDGFVIVLGGDLKPKGGLRKLFEPAANGAALGCYPDRSETLDALIAQIMAEHGLSVSPDARGYLLANLGNDRMISRQELEKLALYKGDDEAPITLLEAMLSVGDSSAEAFDEVGAAAISGDIEGLFRALHRALEAGQSPIGILRLVIRRFERLHLVAGLVEAGNRPESAIKALRPPAFGRESAELSRLVRLWPAARLADALLLLAEAELQCKSTGMPDEAITARALLRLAGAARGAASRTPAGRR